jgi:hypothetical protein
MGLLVGTAFAIWVVYSFAKGLGNCDGAIELVSYIAGIAFVFWLVGAIFG